MPQFAFIAKDRLGNTVQGKVDAPDTALAANKIGQMGYSLVELVPAGLSPAEPTTAFSPPHSPAPPAADSNRTQAMPTSPPHPEGTRLRGGEGSLELPGSVKPVARSGSVPSALGHAGFLPLASQSTLSAPAPGDAGFFPLASSPMPAAPAAQSTDVLQADAAGRRKVEMDLARMGMKPDEIKRLLDANPNTTAPPPMIAASLPVAAAKPLELMPRSAKQAAQHKLAARAADLQSFAAQLQSSSAAARVQAVEAVTLDLPDFRASTTQERQQAEAILREVYAMRRREKYADALGKCREALNLVPSDAAALEMFGDLLQGVARTNEAMAAYKRATEADPKRASAERKYGDLLVRQQQWNEPDTEEVPKNPMAAAAFSLLLPGAGQIHTGQTLKGVVLLTCAAISMAALLYLMRNETPWQTSSEKPAHAPVATTREKRVAIDWTGQAPVIACVAFYSMLSLGSAIDAASFAQRARQRH